MATTCGPSGRHLTTTLLFSGLAQILAFRSFVSPAIRFCFPDHLENFLRRFGFLHRASSGHAQVSQRVRLITRAAKIRISN